MGQSTFSLSCKRRSTSMDGQSTHGPSVSSVDKPVNFLSLVANDGRLVRPVSQLNQ
uniref:Gag-pol polyprotein n=1 Tax=Solanum tuberosum TaxID=4113 RepID=M1AKM8_SOLTU